MEGDFTIQETYDKQLPRQLKTPKSCDESSCEAATSGLFHLLFLVSQRYFGHSINGLAALHAFTVHGCISVCAKENSQEM